MARYTVNGKNVGLAGCLIAGLVLIFLLVLYVTVVGALIAFGANTLLGFHWELGQGVLAAFLIWLIGSLLFRR